jgi:hypothetical protein
MDGELEVNAGKTLLDIYQAGRAGCITTKIKCKE